MINLEKALIPKPQKLTAYGEAVTIAQFNSPAFVIKFKEDDVRIKEGVSLIRQKLSPVLYRIFLDKCVHVW